MSGATITEKILSRIMGHAVTAGEIIYPVPELVTVHDWYVVNFDAALREIGVDHLFDPARVLISTDHEPLAVSPAAAERQKKVRDIVRKYGISQFYDVGRGGLGHVFPIEMGLIRPGMFIEAYDVHVTNYGAVGALALPFVIEISEVLALGSVWVQVPQTVRVDLVGRMTPGTLIRDVAQKLIADLGDERVNYAVVEFGGSAMADIDIAGRQTLCNTPIDIGAKSCLVEPDAVTREYLAGRTDVPYEMVASDAGAAFRTRVEYDLGKIAPQVALPPTPDNVVDVDEVVGRPIQHAFIGSCASGNLPELRVAAQVLAGRNVHADTRLFITPTTQAVAAEAAREGLLEIFYQAGATITLPGCGPCAGGRIGPVASGEASINTGTRNDFGRLGAADAQVYLASPMTVAASAVEGRIADPRRYL
jgi:3-isopropylmalate/(R)-2-methylmalate dehydratase large subunit